MLRYQKWLLIFMLVQFIEFSWQNGIPPPGNSNLIPFSLPPNTITCNSKYTRISFNATIFQQTNISGPGVFFLARNDSELIPFGMLCKAQRVGDIISLNLTDNRINCAYNVRFYSNIVELSYLVRFANPNSTAMISRSYNFEFRLNCSYPAQVQGYLGPLNPIHTERRFRPTSDQKGKFVISFTRRYSDQVVASGHVDQVPYPVYIIAKLETSPNDTNFVLQGTSCYATPTPNRDDQTRINFIQNSCPVNQTEQDRNYAVMSNYAIDSVVFRFSLFYWGHIGPINSQIYVHCCFKVCNMKVTNTCISSYNDLCNASAPTAGNMYAGGRRKRSLTMDKNDEIRTIYGPIEVKSEKGHFDLTQRENPKIESPTPKSQLPIFISREASSNLLCDKNKLGCSYDCARLESDVITCVCPPRFGLSEDGKTCFHQKTGLYQLMLYFLDTEKSIEGYRRDPYIVPVSAALFSLICYIIITARNLSQTEK